MKEIAVSIGGDVPAFVFDEGAIGAQVHCCVRSAMGAMGHKLARYAHVVLLIHHGQNALLIVPGFLAAWAAALEETVIALRIEQAMLVESRALEAVINVGGEHEVIAAAYEFE